MISDSTTATRMPHKTPTVSTPNAVTIASQNSRRRTCRKKRNAAMSINPSEATMMMAPSATVGSGASRGVKKSRKMMVSAAAMSPTHCVLPPI